MAFAIVERSGLKKARRLLTAKHIALLGNPRNDIQLLNSFPFIYLKTTLQLADGKDQSSRQITPISYAMHF
ncbi:hypothetical protein [Camelliibacillus cellulosilyticus]|uniref:hypothetical protein n=1 Tax=Camelliibacillus cellulosilyticus TaxID=2174486 RepID=UPI003670EBB1